MTAKEDARAAKPARRQRTQPAVTPIGDLPLTIDWPQSTEGPFDFVRSQAVAIAKDRVEHMSDEAKAPLLALIDATLEKWKLEQAQSDGTILLAPSTGGLLGDFFPGKTLADLAATKSRGPKRFSIAELKPEQCAGPFVRSKADLFRNLWLERYEPVTQIADHPGAGLDIVMALLVERDGDSMPPDSLAIALHSIWISVWITAKEFRKSLSEQAALVAEFMAAKQSEREQRDRASKSGAQKKRQTAQMAHAQWKSIANQVWTGDPRLSVKDTAQKVRIELMKRNPQDNSVPSVRTIQDVIGPTKAIAQNAMVRAAKRRPDTP